MKARVSTSDANVTAKVNKPVTSIKYAINRRAAAATGRCVAGFDIKLKNFCYKKRTEIAKNPQWIAEEGPVGL